MGQNLAGVQARLIYLPLGGGQHGCEKKMKKKCFYFQAFVLFFYLPFVYITFSCIYFCIVFIFLFLFPIKLKQRWNKKRKQQSVFCHVPFSHLSHLLLCEPNCGNQGIMPSHQTNISPSAGNNRISKRQHAVPGTKFRAPRGHFR